MRPVHAQNLGLPKLNLPEGFKEKEKTTPTKLPLLAEPELKRLNKEEKQTIGNVVDSLFKNDTTTASDVVPPQNKGNASSATINVNTDSEEAISVTVEKEANEDPRSILDSKKEVAKKQEVKQEAKKVNQVDEVPKEEGSTKEEKVFDTSELFKEQAEDKTPIGSAHSSPKIKSNFPTISHLNKPLYINEPLEESRSREFKKKSVISISNDDFPDSYNDESPYASLERIRKLPSKTRRVQISKDLVIDRGEFTDPFYDEIAGNNDRDEEDIALDDFDLSSIENPLDISHTKKKSIKRKSTKNSKKNFRMKEKGLVVEVKSVDRSSDKFYNYAGEAIAMGQYESAITYYKNLIKKGKKDKRTLFGLAAAYHKAKQYDNAKKAYLETIKLDGNYWSAVNNYIILVTEESPENAEEKLLELWHSNPEFAGIPAQIANLNYKNKNYSKAAQYYSKAISLEPSNYTYYYNFAIVLEKMGDRKSAARVYKKIIESEASDSNLPESKSRLRERYYQLVAN